MSISADSNLLCVVEAPGALAAPLPKTPIFGWDNLWPMHAATCPSVASLPHRSYTTSGRAALHAALRQMELPAGTAVFVPTYHCPTMVAPVVEAGLQPVFYPLGDDGLPDLQRVDDLHLRHSVGAMFVAHYFGLAKSLHVVQAWCRKHGVLMVEDCAHAYFGMAGSAPVGSWGDYATASLSKFFPVPEAGLLTSASRRLLPLQLQSIGLPAQGKAIWDVLDTSCQFGRLAGVKHMLRPLRRWRDRSRHPRSVDSTMFTVEALVGASTDCDMSRRQQRISWAGRALHQFLPSWRIVTRRRENYFLLAELLASAPGARLLAAQLPPGNVPYVLPLWVEGTHRADAVYAQLRAERLPIFRWDRIWPGTPQHAGDTGALWSRQLLQLLCHQDLSSINIRHVADRVTQALSRLNATSTASAP